MQTFAEVKIAIGSYTDSTQTYINNRKSEKRS
jgi:hypothetical protein